MANSVNKFAETHIGDVCAASAIFLTFVRPISLHSLVVSTSNLAKYSFIIKTNYLSLNLRIRGDFQVQDRRKKNPIRTEIGTMDSWILS